MNRAILLAVLLPFSALSAWAIYKVGYIAIFTSHMHPAGFQVLADLVIACTLLMVWMWKDAQATGRNVWPFVGITVFAGSFGPLLYWLTAPNARKMG